MLLGDASRIAEVSDLRFEHTKPELVCYESVNDLPSLLSETKPDIVIADYSEVSFDIKEIFKIVRNFDEQLPFILTTNSESQESALEYAQEHGIIDVIPNVAPKLLVHQLKQAFRHYASQKCISDERHKHEQLRLADQQTKSIKIILDPDGNIEWVNNAFINFYGGNEDDHHGKKPDFLIPGTGYDDSKVQELTYSFLELLPFSVEIQRESSFKNVTWFNLEVTPVFCVNGDLIKYVVVQEDITKRKHSELLLKAVNDITTSLLDSDSLEDISRITTSKLICHFGYEDCVIYTVNDENKSLTQIAALGPKDASDHKVMNPITLKFGEGIVGTAAQEKSVILVNDTSKDPRYVVDDEPRYSELSVPIILDNQVIGVLDSEHAEKNFYSESDVQNLKTVAGVIATKFKAAQDRESKLVAEKSLHENENQLEQITSNIDAAVFRYERLTESTGKMIFVSKKVEEIFEVTQQEVLNDAMSVWGQTIPEDLPRVISEYEAAVKKENASYEMEYRVHTPSGKIKWIKSNGSILKNDGSVISDIICQDITERKLIEQKIQANEQQLRSLTNNIPGAFFRYVFFFDGTESIPYVSEGIEKVLEISAQEILQDASKIWEPVVREDFLKMRPALLRSTRKLEPWNQECKIVTKSGEVKWLRVLGTPKPFLKDAIIWDALLLDITKEKEHELSLKHINERLVEAQNLAQIGDWYVDLDTNVGYVAPIIKDIHELSHEFKLDLERAIDFIKEGPDRDRVKQALDHTIRTGEPFNEEMRVLTANGKEKWVRTRGQIIKQSTGETRLMGTSMDITDEKKLQLELTQNEEQLQENLKEKVVLLSEIHHRVKNNLAIVSGLLDIKALDTEDTGLASTLLDMAQRIKSIAGVHELLYNSQSFSNIPFKSYIENLISTINSTIYSEREIEFDLNIPDGINVNINQAIPLGLLLNELITNSFKYAFEDHDSPKISFSIDFKNGKYTAAYADNGPGFSESEFNNPKTLGFTLITTLFEQLEADTTLNTEGEFFVSFSFEPKIIGSQSGLITAQAS